MSFHLQSQLLNFLKKKKLLASSLFTLFCLVNVFISGVDLQFYSSETTSQTSRDFEILFEHLEFFLI